MISWLGWPSPVFNPLTAPLDDRLTGQEILAGPLGLLIFLPLALLARVGGRVAPCAALVTAGIAWLALTLKPLVILVLLAGVMAGAAWIVLLAQLRKRGRISAATMIACVWIGLHVLVLPLWWHARQPWDSSRMAALHMLGFAYFLLRFVAWGVDWARCPDLCFRPSMALAWILYPPCMRLGPVMRIQEFAARFDAWQPAAPIAWKAVLHRLGLFIFGAVALGLTLRLIPVVPAGSPDFFERPDLYSTAKLFRALYAIPLHVYCLLWTYNELAATTGLLVGIPVDNNFNWLPRATSVRDFWRRWHVTVGAWLREYIYIPLGGRRLFPLVGYTAVFAYSGVWHGASWSFLAWGLLQAGGLEVQRWWDKLRVALGKWAPSGPLWVAGCWALTMQFQVMTIVTFTDFDHLGGRLFAEILRRVGIGA